MKTESQHLLATLKNMLGAHIPPLAVKSDSAAGFELTGTKPGMQGKQIVEGYFFASLVPKANDVRLYFFPIYTHEAAFASISGELRKCLKGKSCFHFKNLTPGLEEEISAMIAQGVKLYQNEGLI